MKKFRLYRLLVKPLFYFSLLLNETVKKRKNPIQARRSLHFQVLLNVVITLLILNFNIFNVQTFTEGASLTGFKKFMSALYDEEAREDILVIAFEDGDFPLVESWDIFNPFDDKNYSYLEECEGELCREMSNAWPLSAHERMQFFEFISDAQPKAIFIDLYMPSARSDSQEDMRAFKSSLEMIVTEKNIPVLLADLPNSMNNNLDLKTENPGILTMIRNDQESAVELVMTGWQGFGNEYPLYIDENTGCVLENTLSKCPPDNSKEEAEKFVETIPRLSAANALYAIKKQNDAKLGSNIKVDPNIKTVAEYSVDGPPLSVMWGSAELSITGKIEKKSWFKKMVNGIGILLSSGPRNMYHRQISGAQALSLVQNEELYRAVQDKYVFIGANIAGINDYHLSPVHGNVPAVHLHSMAFDNLITNRGNEYLRAAPEIGGIFTDNGISILDLFEVLIVAMIFYSSQILRQSQTLPAGKRQLYPWHLIVGFFSIILIITFLMYWVNRWIPANVALLLSLSIISFVPVVDWSVKNFEALAIQKQYMAQFGFLFLILILVFS